MEGAYYEQSVFIGNGFDLAHGLKSNYHNFREYLVQVEKDICAETGETSISEK